MTVHDDDAEWLRQKAHQLRLAGSGPLDADFSIALTDRLEVIANRIERLSPSTAEGVLRSAVTELGKCGSCGGSGKYLNKWVTKPAGGGTGTGDYHEEIVVCTKCEGTGVNPIARAALAGESGEGVG